jgi:hypothetical protein
VDLESRLLKPHRHPLATVIAIIGDENGAPFRDFYRHVLRSSALIMHGVVGRRHVPNRRKMRATRACGVGVRVTLHL